MNEKQKSVIPRLLDAFVNYFFKKFIHFKRKYRDSYDWGPWHATEYTISVFFVCIIFAMLGIVPYEFLYIIFFIGLIIIIIGWYMEIHH